MPCGIYKFTNKINNKSYIGQSSDLEARYKKHLKNMKDPKTPRILLQSTQEVWARKFFF